MKKYLFVIISGLTFFAVNCKKDKDNSIGVLKVSTSQVTEISNMEAVCGGKVISKGSSGVFERGVCWDTASMPTINSNKKFEGSGTGSYTVTLINLIPETEYHVRAFASNLSETAYGEERVFKTQAANNMQGLVVKTNTITGIMGTSAVCGGNVMTKGSSEVKSRGVCWNSSGNPIITDNKTSDGTGAGSYTSNITGLNASTAYYVRAYAINNSDTAYGEQKTFTTASPSVAIPVVLTNTVIDIDKTSAVCGGMVTSEGTFSVTSRGICWSLESNPSIEDNRTSDGEGSGSFISGLTNLTNGKKYYVKAYAVYQTGIVYGEEKSFVALAPTQVMDIQGNIYITVEIGDQTWMAENLRTQLYNDGIYISSVSQQFASYNNSYTYSDTYGFLYTFQVASSNKVCPTGWHVPSVDDWKILENYLISSGYNYDGTTTGNKIAKSLASTALWQSRNETGSAGNTDFPEKRNSTGFNALPGGFYRADANKFYQLTSSGVWWTSTSYSNDAAYVRAILNYQVSLRSAANSKNDMYSIRCLKD